MGHLRNIAAGFIAGAGVMYFADPNRGKRRRAVMRDKTAAAWHDITNELDKAARDLANRTQGMISTARSLVNRSEPDDPVLFGRVRSRIGRAVSHPHAIHVTTEPEGRVILEGPILEREANYLLKSVRSVAGVKEVVNRLELHREAGNISSLQGGVERRRAAELMQENWTPILRITAGALAGAAFYSSARTEGPLRWGAIAGGAALLARAVLNKGFRQIAGIGNACLVNFDKTVHIDAPIEEVYAYWSKFENFPRFMTHLKEVRDLGNGKWHWVAEGPGGFSVPWDAEITEQIPNKLLAWRSVPGSLIRTQGNVRFETEPNGMTRVQIRMSYCPPAGMLGHIVAYLFGADPKTEIDEDMVRLKSLIEIGKTRAHGVPVWREDLAGTATRTGGFTG